LHAAHVRPKAVAIEARRRTFSSAVTKIAADNRFDWH
jgi:hypothetical protein